MHSQRLRVFTSFLFNELTLGLGAINVFGNGSSHGRGPSCQNRRHSLSVNYWPNGGPVTRSLCVVWCRSCTASFAESPTATFVTNVPITPCKQPRWCMRP